MLEKTIPKNALVLFGGGSLAKSKEDSQLRSAHIKNPTYSTVIAVDPENQAFHIYTLAPAISVPNHELKKCRARLFEREFYSLLRDMLTDFTTEHPNAREQYVSIVLPDSAAALDTVSVPAMRKNKQRAAFEVSLASLYQNRTELKVNSVLASQNRQYSTYAISVMRQDILNEFYSILSENKMLPTAVTFLSNTTLNGVFSLCPKLSTESFLYLDIHEDCAQFIFSSKGRTSGFYRLPFGYSVLYQSKLAAEDMLFAHEEAELFVLNAKEKARAKQLSVSEAMIAETIEQEAVPEDGLDPLPDVDNETDTLDAADEKDDDPTKTTVAPVSQPQQQVYKTLPKKQPRKLPKFMLRPTPNGNEEYIYENFRIFVKWALLLLSENDKITAQGAPSAVYVNLPDEYRFVLDMVNREEAENGIRFLPIEFENATKDIIDNLSLYGGLYCDKYNGSNNF